METVTMTLTEFLLARYDEDEAAARAASPGGWTYPGIESVAGGTLYDETRRIVDVVYEQPKDHDGTIIRHLLVPEADANGAHIARHDPARVLADVEAKRRIVEFTQHAQALRDDHADPVRPDSGYVFGQWSGCHVILRHLAAVYADHPDYRDEWRP